MGDARLRRYQKWLTSAAIFIALQVSTYQINHGEHGTIAYYVALVAPFAVALLLQQWLRRRARAQIPPGNWRVLQWLNAALFLRDGWWNSHLQIGRASLISGVAVAALALVVYPGDVPTAAFVGVTFPAIVLASSVWHFRHPPENEPLTPPGLVSGSG